MGRELIAAALVILVIAGYVMLALRVLADAVLSKEDWSPSTAGVTPDTHRVGPTLKRSRPSVAEEAP